MAFPNPQEYLAERQRREEEARLEDEADWEHAVDMMREEIQSKLAAYQYPITFTLRCHQFHLDDLRQALQMPGWCLEGPFMYAEGGGDHGDYTMYMRAVIAQDDARG